MLIVVDLPSGFYQGNSEIALESTVKVMKIIRTDAIKIEGDSEIRESAERIFSAGIPIMGHLGLTSQSINKLGPYVVRAKEQAEADRLLAGTHLLEELGYFALVPEKIPAPLATKTASELTIPVIGIGIGGGVGGQVLTMYDILGIMQGFSPCFLRRYADLGSIMANAVQYYIADVKNQNFPNEEESH